MKYILSLVLAVLSFSVTAQISDMTTSLYDSYSKYKEPSLDKRRMKHDEIQPLINNLKNKPAYTVQKVGESIKGKSISLISIGTGDTSVFLWSQMHGDEPTATQAIFDIFNFLNSPDFKAEKEILLSKLTLHFMPMLNPDGAEVFTRRNALGIDINRDALMLQSPEGQILKRIRDSLDADFGFNLHDQSTYYNAERTPKPATISYLAPAYNYEKDINEVRGKAMKVIVFMNNIIQKYAPGQVGRYNDDFEPRAFGDNIQKWGTSAILIESGGYKNDVEKQEIRKLNFVSILSACYTIANGDYKNIPIEDYEKIPQNDRKLFDLKIERFTHKLLGKDYILDIGINHSEIQDKDQTDFYNVGSIVDKGDLSTFYGYDTVDATGYRLIEGKVYPDIIPSLKELEKMDIYSLLKSGYTYVRVADFPSTEKAVSLPINILDADQKVPGFYVNIGNNPNFVLQKDGSVDYAVVNGFLIDLKAKESNFKNAIFYGK
ncbi:peptidase M14 [Gelidibacter salicanalis]|uniref:Peptidase M14 n=1 Tax=Gelidibacter salicanalis TaxID=291193 RepID=A0A5C7APR5_9FLAO|nr:M14 metallopeptidase family protein [Gelidibacter salicanalis]TXE08535.1 peptidase M14 [Gelidibacter salicanalis]